MATTEAVTGALPALLRVGLSLTGDMPTAEDLCHEAIVRVLPKIDRLGEDPLPYLARTMINLHRTAERRRQHQHRGYQRLAAADLDAEQAPEGSEVLRLVVIDELRALPVMQRQVIALRFIGDLSVAQTANALDCPEGTVRQLTHTAMTALRAGPLGKTRRKDLK